MSRELWLLRHAKAEINDSVNDYDRNLKKRGKKAAERMGLWMKEQQLQPDYVLSSPAVRALATTRLVCPLLGVAEQDIHRDKRLYLASVNTLKKVLAGCPPQAAKVLIVGHNPGLADLLVDLATEVPMLQKLLPTTALARLILPDDWQHLHSGCAEVKDITHVKTLWPNEE